VTAVQTARPVASRSAALRWSVHVLLIVTAVGALVVEPVLTLHVVVGLVFVALVAVHLLQRRRTSARLLRRIIDLKGLHRRPARLAMADMILLLVTAAMLASGVWDWVLGHPTRVRWHAISGVLLAAYLVVHTLRRRTRIRRSQVR
jgi:hypothetical protein